MRRGLPLREYVFLSKWYEDYITFLGAMNGMKRVREDDENQTEEELIGDAPWIADEIVGGKT